MRLLNALRRRLRRTRPSLGAVATDRRLLLAERRALGDHVLVIGDPVAVHQALPDARIDLLGTQPFDRRVTVLSDGLGAGALPFRRWSGIVLVDPPSGTASSLLEAASYGCRSGGMVVVLTGPRRRDARRVTRYLVS